MRPEAEVEALADALDRCGEILAWPEERLYAWIETVSAWAPAQHVQHLQRMLALAYDAIRALDEGSDTRIQPSGHPGLAGRAILAIGWIPRGRGEAPERLLPEPRPVRHELADAHARLREGLEGLAPLLPRLPRIHGTLPHPILGPFRAKDWLRFGRVHTEHHLAIIDDLDRGRLVGAPAPVPGATG
jgi:DinB superfamily